MQCHCDKSSSSGSHFAGSPRESDWSPARRPCACKSMARRPSCQLVFNLQSVPPFKVDADENESHHALSFSPQRRIKRKEGETSLGQTDIITSRHGSVRVFCVLHTWCTSSWCAQRSHHIAAQTHTQPQQTIHHRVSFPPTGTFVLRWNSST